CIHNELAHARRTGCPYRCWTPSAVMWALNTVATSGPRSALSDGTIHQIEETVANVRASRRLTHTVFVARRQIRNRAQIRRRKLLGRGGWEVQRVRSGRWPLAGSLAELNRRTKFMI